MCKKRRDKPVRVPPRPPFPSFAWVMTAQSNPPPSPAYACGYGRNAHARSGTHGRLPARRTLPHGCHHQPRCPRSTRPSRLPTRAKATGGLTAERDEQFMDTVDYRYHDPPSRPYVPWLEGYTSLRRRGAQRATDPDTTTRDSNCTLAGSASSSSDDARSKKKRSRTTVDVMKINRLDIMLSALRRACGLSAKEEPGKP